MLGPQRRVEIRPVRRAALDRAAPLREHHTRQRRQRNARAQRRMNEIAAAQLVHGLIVHPPAAPRHLQGFRLPSSVFSLRATVLRSGFPACELVPFGGCTRSTSQRAAFPSAYPATVATSATLGVAGSPSDRRIFDRIRRITGLATGTA